MQEAQVIEDYDIIMRQSYADLREVVKEQMQRGWQPLGGHNVVSTSGGYGSEYSQTMVKYATASV